MPGSIPMPRGKRKRPIGAVYGSFASTPLPQCGHQLQPLCRSMKAAGIELDRKVLADLAVHDEIAFGALVQKAKVALKAKVAARSA